MRDKAGERSIKGERGRRKRETRRGRERESKAVGTNGAREGGLSLRGCECEKCFLGCSLQLFARSPGQSFELSAKQSSLGFLLSYRASPILLQGGIRVYLQVPSLFELRDVCHLGVFL